MEANNYVAIILGAGFIVCYVSLRKIGLGVDL